MGTQELLFSIIVCTKGRGDQLARCIESLSKLKDDTNEILVVDNAPDDESVYKICKNFPVTYCKEQKEGLDYARNRGINSSNGKYILFTDDDCVADNLWAKKLIEPLEEESVACCTGRVLSYIQQTDVQALIEKYKSFDRGSVKKEYSATKKNLIFPLSAGIMGTGANMAFKKKFFTESNLFDIHLDCGTPVGGAGDLDMFYKVIQKGYKLVYTPHAIIYHDHRKTMAALKKMRFYTGVSSTAFAIKSIFKYHETFRPALFLLTKLIRHFGEIIFSILQIRKWPVTLVLIEMAGMIWAPIAYFYTVYMKK